MQDLARPDSACCQKYTRSSLLSIIASNCQTHDSDCTIDNDNKLKWIIARKLHVSSVVLNMSKVDVSHLNDLFQYSGDKICKIRVKLTSTGSSNDHNLLRTIAHNCRNLLQFSMNALSDEDVQHIVQHCPKLQRIWPLTAVSDSGVLVMANNCPMLTELDLSRNDKISDASVVPLLQNCRCLKQINLMFVRNITNSAVQEIRNSSQHLNYFVIAGCPLVTDDGIALVAQHCNRIEHLILSQYGDIAVTAVARGCSLLQNITLHECTNVSDLSIRAIAEGCPALSCLNISCSHRPNSLITSGGTAAIARCTKLSRLYLVGVVNVSDVLLIQLGKCCSDLNILFLTECAAITDIGVAALSGCVILDSLALNSCDAVTDSGVISVMRGCQQIEHLSISRNANVTDAGLEAVLSSSSSLKTLLCWECAQVSESMIGRLNTMRKEYSRTIAENRTKR